MIAALHKNEYESKDGMDIAICRIDHQKHALQYAGAMRPLWIVRKGQITEMKADKIPIGTKEKERAEGIIFHTQNVKPEKGDVFYIFTDGYVDQFGGENDKKFTSSKLRQLLAEVHSLDFRSQENRLREEHLKWKGDNEQVDDICVIGFML